MRQTTIRTVVGAGETMEMNETALVLASRLLVWVLVI